MSKVLVVDDEKGFTHMLASMLRDRGFATAEATNGTEALDLVREGSIDVLLCDVVMPGLAGTALLQAIRAVPETAGLPVIFMSALAEERVRKLVHGEFHFLGKPFMIDRAVMAVRAAEPAARRRAAGGPA